MAFQDFWYKSIFAFSDLNTISSNHPEIFYIFQNLNDEIFSYWTSKFFSILITDNITENSLSPVVLFVQIVLFLYFTLLLSLFLFNFFGNPSTEENTIDHDYMINTLLVESEEEVGSLDDMVVGGIIFFYIFGWYFYFNAMMLLSWLPEISLVIYLFPGIYYIIICIPTLLLYDFGLFFISYLKGVGTSSVMIFELVFDYIAFMAFYIRLCVQGVRLVLMIFVYVSLHDLIILSPIPEKLILGNQSLFDMVSNLSLSYESFSYFLFTKLPIKVLYWIYELGHTFFVVTAQFIAFFAMVFWLFFFLYTFFVFEKFENYFYEKRKLRQARLATLLK